MFTKNKKYIGYVLLACIICTFIYVTLFQEGFQNESTTKEYTFTAIIVEPRKHPAFDFVLGNFLDNLDERWSIMVFHGTDNETFVKDIIASKNTDRVSIVNTGRSNLTAEEYKAYMISTEFLDKVPTEIFLIFQTDSMICSENKDLLEQFLKYDYVGAPWKELPKEFERKGNFVGNGGLSLRRKSKMLEILKKCSVTPSVIPEDVFFSFACPGVSIYKPSLENAKEFAIETIYNPKTWGIHAAWKKGNLMNEHVEDIEQQCKGYKLLTELNTIV
jgi:hypothetical protein